MRGVFLKHIVAGRFRSAVLRNNCNAIHVNLSGQLRRVVFRDQAARDLGKVRIAQPIGAVSEGQLHRFSHHMNEIRRAWPHRLEVEVFQNVQYLRDVNTAGTRRWKPDQLEAAIGAEDWFA